MIQYLVLATLLTTTAASADATSAPDYASQVAPILQKYCAGCHNDDDREGEFSLESYASLQKGSEPALRSRRATVHRAA